MNKYWLQYKSHLERVREWQ